MTVLRFVLLDAVDLTRRRDITLAKRERRDALRRREIAFEQHRRNAEDVGVVVEAGARIIRRQQRGGVDLDGQQIANGVRVFRAVQTMREWAAGIRIGLPATYEPSARQNLSARPTSRRIWARSSSGVANCFSSRSRRQKLTSSRSGSGPSSGRSR